MRRKGDSAIWNFLVPVVILFIVILIVLSIATRIASSNALYDRFASPIAWGGEQVIKAGGKKFINTCNNFIEEVTSLFVYSELEIICNEWYEHCTKNINATSSPWKKIENTETDLNAVNYLNLDCRTEKVDTLKEKWKEKNSYFASKSEYEQYMIIKNACGATLVSRIYK